MRPAILFCGNPGAGMENPVEWAYNKKLCIMGKERIPMSEQMRAFGYICPDCGRAVYGERTQFALCA